MTAIAAGGWVVLIVIVIICLIAAVVACFGIFFSSEDTGSDKPMRTVVQEINQDYQTQLDDIKASVTYDTPEMSGSRAVWPEVLSVYAVKVTSDPDNPQEAATVTPEKEQILRDIFWAMNTTSHSTTMESVTTIIEIGVIPKFAGCVNGVQWFRDRGQCPALPDTEYCRKKTYLKLLSGWRML